MVKDDYIHLNELEDLDKIIIKNIFYSYSENGGDNLKSCLQK